MANHSVGPAAASGSSSASAAIGRKEISRTCAAGTALSPHDRAFMAVINRIGYANAMRVPNPGLNPIETSDSSCGSDLWAGNVHVMSRDFAITENSAGRGISASKVSLKIMSETSECRPELPWVSQRDDPNCRPLPGCPISQSVPKDWLFGIIFERRFANLSSAFSSMLMARFQPG